MKKILLSALTLALGFGAYSQARPINPGFITGVAVFDDFQDGNEFVDGVNEYTAEDTERNAWNMMTQAPDTGNAFRGLFWSEANGESEGFFASNTRNTANSSLDYILTTTEASFQPFVLTFGSFAGDNGLTDYTIDLSGNATGEFNVTNSGDLTIRFSVQLQDALGNSIVYLPSVIDNEDAFFEHNIGFVQGETAPLSPGATELFSFDFATGVTGCQPGNLVGGQPGCDDFFDFTQVRGITFTFVNDESNEDFLPLPITDYPVSIGTFALGDQILVPVNRNEELVESTIYPNPASTEVNFSETLETVTIMNTLGNVVFTGTDVNTVDVSSFEAGVYSVVSDKGSRTFIVE